MLDRLILKYLTKQGRIIYFIGQLASIVLWMVYLIGIKHYSISRGNDGRSMLYIGAFFIVIFWAGLCLTFWRKKDEKNS